MSGYMSYFYLLNGFPDVLDVLEGLHYARVRVRATHGMILACSKGISIVNFFSADLWYSKHPRIFFFYNMGVFWSVGAYSSSILNS